VFWRGFVATVLIGGYILIRRLPLATPHARTHVVRGLAGFVSLVMYFYAIAMIPLAAAVTLNYTSPLFLALLLVLWAGEPVRRGFHVVLAAGFVGVILLLQPTLAREQWLGALPSASARESFPASPTSTCGAWASWASRNGARCSIFPRCRPLAACPGCWRPGHFHAIDLRGWLLLLGVGGFGVLAQLCMTAAYKRGKTLTSASLAYSTVVFSSLFAMLLWDETLSWLSWAASR
jgi:drug/metabolite transporter (DMT)-like permease